MNRHMQTMSDRDVIQMMHDIKVPTDHELQTLVAYLQQHAQMSIDKARHTDLSTPAGILFEATCSQRHVLPDPKQYTADEWPGVVQRTAQNMKTHRCLIGQRSKPSSSSCKHMRSERMVQMWGHAMMR